MGSLFSVSGLASGIDTDGIIEKAMALARRPALRLQSRQADLTTQLAAWQDFNAKLLNLQAQANNLNTAAAFSPIKAASSDQAVAIATASSEAVPGTYNIAVSKLAQFHKISSGVYADQSSALGLSGEILVNGKKIGLRETDTLANLRTKINDTNAGVTASLLTTQPGEYRLTLTSSASGTPGAIQVADVGSGTLAQGLGWINGSVSLKNSVEKGAASDQFADSATAVGSLLGLSSPASGTIQINGTGVAVDMASDSLTDIAAHINAAGIAGVSASVESVSDGSSVTYRLKITGADTPVLTDDRNILTGLGVLKNDAANQLTAAQDALFTVDGLWASKSSNTVSDLIPGVTLTLLAADAANPKTATLSFERDVAGIKSAVNNFVDSYNTAIGFIKDQFTFDSETMENGVLFGDYTLQGIQTDLVEAVSETVDGLPASMSMLSQAGITLDQNNRLVVNDAKLTQALNTDPNGVMELFRTGGTTTDSQVTFLSATDKTKPSANAPYSVYITQAAQQSSAASGTAQTSASASAEKLTFSGLLFGSATREITLKAGNSLDDSIAQINADATLNRDLIASKSAEGNLVISSRQAGSAYSFKVVSDQAASADNSGIGNVQVTAQGLDVAGTINGEAATGTGQILVGNSGNSNTAGLAIRIAATTAGDHGTIALTQGIGAQVGGLVKSLTDLTAGALANAQSGVLSQIDDIKTRVTDMEALLTVQEERMREQFLMMESTLSKLQSQGQWLSSQISQMTGSSSSKK
ncbi:MAG: flagellar filament capping protein FliD [Armatimonadetes bacterium]|nr:flagellar filament capping protein FliD [Armatimonadota bacterium]